MPAHEVLTQVGHHLQSLHPDLIVTVPSQGTLTEVLGLISSQLLPTTHPTSSSSASTRPDEPIKFSRPRSLSASAVFPPFKLCSPGPPAIFPDSDPKRAILCYKPSRTSPETFSGVRNPPPPAMTPFPSEYGSMHEIVAAVKRFSPSHLAVPAVRRFDSIPVVRGQISFPFTIEKDFGYIFQTQEIDLVWDSGACSCMAAQELLPNDTLGNIRLHHRTEGNDILCPIEIKLASVQRTFRSFIRLRPRAEMPSQYLGVLLGQDDFLRRFQYTMTSSEICILEGRTLNPECWGIIELHKYKVGLALTDPNA